MGLIAKASSALRHRSPFRKRQPAQDAVTKQITIDIGDKEDAPSGSVPEPGSTPPGPSLSGGGFAAASVAPSDESSALASAAAPDGSFRPKDLIAGFAGFWASMFSTEQIDDGLERCSSCYLPTTWLGVELIARREYNANTTLYTFGLPDGRGLDLPVCACVLLRAPGRGRIEGEGGSPGAFDPDSDAVRPYTPVTDQPGRFEILVKRYDDGAVSQYLYALQPGATVEFKHIPFNIKAQCTRATPRAASRLPPGRPIRPRAPITAVPDRRVSARASSSVCAHQTRLRARRPSP